jgi:Zn-dependent alcohol dehydrogenase
MPRQCRPDAHRAGELSSRLGPEHHHRRRRLRPRIATRPFQLVTGRAWRGTAFSDARGRSDVPRIVDWYMQGKIEIDRMITHTMPLADINKAFALMRDGKSIRSVVEY